MGYILIVIVSLAHAQFKLQVVKPVDPVPVPPVTGDLTTVTPNGAAGASGAPTDESGAAAEKSNSGANPLGNMMQSMGMPGGQGAGAPAGAPTSTSTGSSSGSNNSAPGTPAYSDSTYSPQSAGNTTREGVGDPGALGDTIQCSREGVNACGAAEFKLDPVAPGYFAGFQSPERERRFIEWLKPAALYIQAQTGFPASVIMGQAAHESGFGTGPAFSKATNIFGHSCWTLDEIKSGRVQLGDKVYDYTAPCEVPRGDESTGWYLKFRNFEESVLGYINNILQSTKLYQGLQAEVRNARVDGRVLDYKVALAKLVEGGYASDSSYSDKVLKTIHDHNFQALDSDPCALCLRQQERSGQTGNPEATQ